MQLEQSTSAPVADAHAISVEQRTTEEIRTTVSTLEHRITEQFLAANAALLAHLQTPTTAFAITNQQQSTPPTRH
jgi:outer membrane phospholipase A